MAVIIFPAGSNLLYAKTNEGGVITQYAYLPATPPGVPTPPTTAREVPLLVTSKNDDRWNVRSEKAADASPRIAEDLRYTSNHDNLWTRLIAGERQVHHILADNIWRAHPMLQEILERCAGAVGSVVVGGVSQVAIENMDRGNNLIELAENKTSRDNATAIHGTTKISQILHYTSHPEYDKYVYRELNAASNSLGNNFKNTDCTAMVSIVNEVTQTLRDKFLNKNGIPLPSGLLEDIGSGVFRLK
jgi:A nuclease family of the HNH/ENDO VII superfamily with conserved AHH